LAFQALQPQVLNRYRLRLRATVVVETLLSINDLIVLLSSKTSLAGDFAPSFCGCKEQAGAGHFVRERQPWERGAPHRPWMVGECGAERSQQETGATRNRGQARFFRPDFFEGLLRPHCLCGRVRLAGTASPHLRGGRTGCTRWGRIGLHPLKMAPFGPDSIFCARSRRSARPSELGITIHIHEHMHGRGSRRAGSAGLRTRRG